MGIAANPPPQARLPEKLLQDDELRPFFTTLQEDMYRIWLRSGGGTDKVSEIELDLDTINERLSSLESRLTYLEGTIIVTAVDVTAFGNTTIICTDALTVELNADPLDKDLVKVKARNGNVTIDGNGKNIDGNSSVIIRRNFTGLDMVYSSELDVWSIV